MKETLKLQAKAVLQELYEKAKLKTGAIVVIGCSTSEIIGSKIGTDSSPDIACAVFEAFSRLPTRKPFTSPFNAAST